MQGPDVPGPASGPDGEIDLLTYQVAYQPALVSCASERCGVEPKQLWFLPALLLPDVYDHQS